MSAEAHEPHPASAGRSGSEPPGHSRSRRGRRRGGRRRSADRTPRDHSARTRGSSESGGGDSGATGRSPSRPVESAPEHLAGTTSGEKSGEAVKPSDLNARARQRVSHRSRSGRPAARSAGSDAAPAARLHTVRETSAGGLVVSGMDGRPDAALSAALIGRVDRRGRMMWSLPKGHIETGETAEQTAMREVAEETGITGNVVASLGKIEYWFVNDGRRIHKTVHHYLLRSVGGELSDADYEVAAVAWVPLKELPHRLTYSDERRLARAAVDVIAELADDPDRLARSEADAVRTEPNDYEKAAAARNQRRNEPLRSRRPRRRRRGRRPIDQPGRSDE